MTGFQEDSLNMLYSVRTVVDKYQSTWTTNAVFAATYNILTGKIVLIEQNRDAQMANLKGITTDKNVKRNALTEKALFMVKRISSYATVSGNNELLESVHYTQSNFDKSRDTDIVGMVDIILAKANANITALATYGVTAALVTDLQAALTAYSSNIAKPRTVTSQAKNATENLAALFKEVNDILTKRLDLDIEVFKTTKPDFYSQYQTARMIISTGGGATSVIGSVTDAATGEPIKGATFTFVADNNGTMKAAKSEAAQEIVKKSAEKGKFRTSLPEDTYKVTVEKVGFKKKDLLLTVVNGETTNLDVELEKN